MGGGGEGPVNQIFHTSILYRQHLPTFFKNFQNSKECPLRWLVAPTCHGTVTVRFPDEVIGGLSAASQYGCMLCRW